MITIKDPVSISDLHATIFTAMGISPKTGFDVEKRPFYVTEDGKGLPVKSLFARQGVLGEEPRRSPDACPWFNKSDRHGPITGPDGRFS